MWRAPLAGHRRLPVSSTPPAPPRSNASQPPTPHLEAHEARPHVVVEARCQQHVLGARADGDVAQHVGGALGDDWGGGVGGAQGAAGGGDEGVGVGAWLGVLGLELCNMGVGTCSRPPPPAARARARARAAPATTPAGMSSLPPSRCAATTTGVSKLAPWISASDSYTRSSPAGGEDAWATIWRVEEGYRERGRRRVKGRAKRADEGVQRGLGECAARREAAPPRGAAHLPCARAGLLAQYRLKALEDGGQHKHALGGGGTGARGAGAGRSGSSDALLRHGAAASSLSRRSSPSGPRPSPPAPPHLGAHDLLPEVCDVDGVDARGLAKCIGVGLGLGVRHGKGGWAALGHTCSTGGARRGRVFAKTRW
jgi:hypothetical protein